MVHEGRLLGGGLGEMHQQFHRLVHDHRVAPALVLGHRLLAATAQHLEVHPVDVEGMHHHHAAHGDFPPSTSPSLTRWSMRRMSKARPSISWAARPPLSRPCPCP